ncbi:riboflavin transporter FmnP [Flavobacterium gossypii]|uniref:Riboflavin transporter FmnP n=1 Tax=Flavobacterium gossypii TaxID=1646119 RepID=A0ABR6DPW7_9FLAO|nr:hypothetical protein [Flavobacterium gossypii]MBA9073504.1 riboflavin transporter FmnP [Flavobacterium gossypii]
MKYKNPNRISEIIGKTLFYLFVIISTFVTISFNLSRLKGSSEVSIIIGSVLGNILAVVLIYYFWRLLFRPIYGLRKNINLYYNNQLSDKEFKKKWIISLICSLIFGILFIVGSFGFSFLLMIPQYILLKESRIKTYQIPPRFNLENSLLPSLRAFKSFYDFKKLTIKEVVIISIGFGLVVSILSGSLFCKTKYYRLYKGKSVEVSKDISTFELCGFNYLLAIACFILFAGLGYFYLNNKRKATENG